MSGYMDYAQHTVFLNNSMSQLMDHLRHKQWHTAIALSKEMILHLKELEVKALWLEAHDDATALRNVSRSESAK